MVSMNNIYCSFCGKRLDKCNCAKSNPVETKVINPPETKRKKIKKQQDEEQVK